MGVVRDVAIGALAALSVAAGGFWVARESSAPQAAEATEESSPSPLSSNSGYTANMSPELAAHHADLIATGQILHISEPRWATSDGATPDTLNTGPNVAKGMEYRVATVRIGQVISGEAAPEILVGMPLARVNGEFWSNWTEGNELLVYLVASIPGWRLTGSDYGILWGTTVEGDIAKGHPEFGLDEGDIPIAQVVTRVQKELNKMNNSSD